MTLKSQIIKTLETLPKTRDSDQYLTLMVWIRYYPEYIKFENGNPYIFLKDVMVLPREDNCKRIRAKLNEQGLYLSDNPKVLKARKQKQSEWQKELEYNYKPNIYL